MTHTFLTTANPALRKVYCLVNCRTMLRKFQLSVQFRKASAGSVSVQHASVAPAAVCIASDQSPSPKSVREVKVSVPLHLIYDSDVSTVTKLKRE